jgi:hypothetical protein
VFILACSSLENLEDIFDIFCSIGNLKFISIFGTASFFVLFLLINLFLPILFLFEDSSLIESDSKFKSNNLL